MFIKKKKPILSDIKDKPIIAIWGSPFSGKTTLAVNLAKYISSQKQKVILITADSTTPAVPYIFLPKNISNINSLGKLLEKTNTSLDDVHKHFIELNGNSNLRILSYIAGDNNKTFNPYTSLEVSRLFSFLKQLDAFIIIDCCSNLINDVLSSEALKSCDVAFNLISGNLKAISFMSSNFEEFNKIIPQNYYNIFSCTQKEQKEDLLKSAKYNPTFNLSYTNEIYSQFNNGNYYFEFISKKSKPYTNELMKIYSKILEERSI